MYVGEELSPVAEEVGEEEWDEEEDESDLAEVNGPECLYDAAFAVKELASRMSNPTAMSFHHLKKFLGYLKTMDYCLVLELPLCQERRRLLVLGDILRFRLGRKQNP